MTECLASQLKIRTLSKADQTFTLMQNNGIKLAFKSLKIRLPSSEIFALHERLLVWYN